MGLCGVEVHFSRWPGVVPIFPYFVLEKVEKPAKAAYEFKPFEKVLLRDDLAPPWRAGFFSHMVEQSKQKYCATWASWQYCIPYEGNEHLLGTTTAAE